MKNLPDVTLASFSILKYIKDGVHNGCKASKTHLTNKIKRILFQTCIYVLRLNHTNG